VKEDDVAPEDQPPAVEDLDNKRIGVFTQEGLDDNIIAPPITDNKGVIIVPAQNDADQNKVFIKVEIESAYPGGMNAWKRFLLKTMKYPQRAVEENITGTVVVKFIVDKEGAVSNVQAISGPEALTAEAARVILSSGRWTPAIQNGKHVNSYKEQAINFQLNSE
jgi:protein TonB